MHELEGAPGIGSDPGGGGGESGQTTRVATVGTRAILEQLSHAVDDSARSAADMLGAGLNRAAESSAGAVLLWSVNDGHATLARAVGGAGLSETELVALAGTAPIALSDPPFDVLKTGRRSLNIQVTTLGTLIEATGRGGRPASSTATSAPATPTAADPDLRSRRLVLVTIAASGAVTGVLGLVSPSGDDPPPVPERGAIAGLVAFLGLAMENARLVQQTAAEVTRAEVAEEARRFGDMTISLVARAGPILLFACDQDGIVTLMDGGLLTQFQLRSENFVGKPFLEIFGDYAVIADHARRVLEGEPIRRAQIPFEGRSLEAWAQPLRGSDGTVTGFAGIVVDVSARVAAEAAVLDAARRQAALVEHASDVIIVMTGDGTIHYVNPACQRVLGYSWRAGDVVDVLSLVHPDDRDRCRDAIREAFRRPGAQALVAYRIRHADGSYRYIESIGNNLLDDPGISGFVVTIRDVTDQRVTEVRLRANADRQAALAELGRWALVGLDYSSLIEDAVDVLSEQLGADMVHVFESYADASLLTLAASKGHVVAGSELMSNDPTSSPASFALVTQETVVSDDLRHEDRFDVPQLWTRSSAVSTVEIPIPGEDMPVGVVGVGSRSQRSFVDEDVNFVRAVANVLAAASARSSAERAIRAQALQDPLTGLPNRLLLAEHSASAAAPGPNQPLTGTDRTVFVLDIDRFKEINDTLGHATGDLVLIEIARRLERIGDPVELVARLGGDEFAVVGRHVGSAEDEQILANRLLSVVGEPLDVGGVNLRLRGSIGIASPDPERDNEETEISALVRRAEVAMYQAKSDHAGVRRYFDDLERSSLSRLALASELAEAIDHGQLRLDYQPKVSATDARITGVEALVRWQHPTRGLLLPDVFVPLAEQTGIIRELTNWVLARALAECASWHRAGWPMPVAVNLSASTVHDPSLLEAVMAAIARSGLPTSAIELEITESAVMLDPKGALRILQELTERGVRFALDDFGTGYSSLAYLQRLPVTSVKIDKSFVTPLSSDQVAQAIVRAVVDLGHSLHLAVIAEGVDSAEVQEVLRRLGCDDLQGFHVARPMDAAALRRWITEHAPAAPQG